MMTISDAFKQYRAMIEGAVWDIAKKRYWYRDIEDLRSQAFLIFCESYEKYDENKASFSTFLHSRLRTLNDYCTYQKRRNEMKEITIKRRDWNYETFCATIERVESYITLSQDAQDIIKFILKREWENVEGRCVHPSFNSVQKLYREKKEWTLKRTKVAWNEIKTWWRSYDHPIKQEA